MNIFKSLFNIDNRNIHANKLSLVQKYIQRKRYSFKCHTNLVLQTYNFPSFSLITVLRTFFKGAAAALHKIYNCHM